MNAALITLDKAEHGYTVFELNQVLKPEQLNSLAAYLDDQQRLTRVALIGVGIACGLWPSLDGELVRLTHGVGTTTDGDLVVVPKEVSYDRYRPYDGTTARYAPFFPPNGQGAKMIPAFELVPEDVDKDDERARKLTAFGDEDRQLNQMVALLYVESHLHDPDLCTGTDCDNRGMDALHRRRLLLVDAKSVSALNARLVTAENIGRTLEPVVADRAALPGAIGSEAAIVGAYRAACSALHGALLKALDGFYEPCKALLREVAPKDPAPQWIETLEKHRADVTANPRGIQYYYDFLKDVAETYNALRDALLGDVTVCCPGVDAFPKHLVLGALDPKLRGGERTLFYPSPATSATDDHRLRALFLVRKLDALIATFFVPRQPADIRITPSAFEQRPLEERAIPFYYAQREDLPVHLAWSYERTQRGMERYNYSYHASAYHALGGAANPAAAQIGAFDFFRIEGHLGWDVRQAAQVLRERVRAQNLPIDVETVLAGTERPRVVVDRPWRNLELHRLRHLMRTDLAAGLDHAAEFAKDFAGQVSAAYGTLYTNEDVGPNIDAPKLAADQSKTIDEQAKKASAKLLAAGYGRAGEALEDVKKTDEAVMLLRQKLGPVTKDDYASPLDALLVSPPKRWVGWLDDLIQDAEDKDAERLFLGAYLEDHPGLEHFAGALRGGTFVLVHDTNHVVVADFMLPYRCCEPRAERPALPTLPLPPKPPKPPHVEFPPIRLIPLPDKFRITKLKEEFVSGLQKDIEVHKSYFTAFKDTINLMSGFAPKTGAGAAAATAGVKDAVLGGFLKDTIDKTTRVDELRDELLNPDLTAAARTALEGTLKSAEAELGDAILAATQHVADTGLDVTTGSDAATVMRTASASLAKVNDIDALARVESGFNTISAKPTTKPALNTMIGAALSLRMR
jgi:hypothetical protein